MMIKDLENQEIGILKQRRELAQDMLSDNEPVDKILKYSKLEPKDLKEVADSMNITVTIPGYESLWRRSGISYYSKGHNMT